MPKAPFVGESRPLAGIQVIRARGLAHEFPRHRHNSHLFGLVVTGAREIETATQLLHVGPRQGFSLAAGATHRCRCVGAHAYRVVAVSPSVWQRLGVRPPPVQARLLDDRALATLRALLYLLLRAPDEFAVDTALLALHADAGGSETAIPASTDQEVMVTRVRCWIDTHCTEVVRLSTLAAIAQCSPGLINRIFRQSLGVPPYEYLLQRRLALAARRLREDGEALSEIALEFGFSDQSHFHRHFRRAFGTTPAAYRAASQLQVRPAAD